MEAQQPLSWEELELPVLQWALAPAHEQLDFSRGESSSPLAPELTDDQVDDALQRLQKHGLIVGDRWEGAGAGGWTALRPTSDGLRVLGEWPPVAEAAVTDALVRVLRELADNLPEDEATTVRRAGSAVSKMSGEVVLDTLKGEVQRLGEELGG